MPQSISRETGQDREQIGGLTFLDMSLRKVHSLCRQKTKNSSHPFPAVRSRIYINLGYLSAQKKVMCDMVDGSNTFSNLRNRNSLRVLFSAFSNTFSWFGKSLHYCSAGSVY